jgi:hypothetical protein
MVENDSKAWLVDITNPMMPAAPTSHALTEIARF